MDTAGPEPDMVGLSPEQPSVAQALPPHVESPAIKQLASIGSKGGRTKSKTSRLRRALSFGSSAEFRKAVGPPDGDENGPVRGKSQQKATPEELYDAEQARIALQQEASGLGNSIYSGGKLFTTSNDNMSISSTASSASIMIRKMGRGMKKGGRSLAGLFRPKSTVGHPVTDPIASEASQTAVSMITAEAERERVNVNVDPHDQPGGGTGFPHLERNSIDATKGPLATLGAQERGGSSGTDTSATRRGIIGGERDRAEVLASVRKGILKREHLVSTVPTDVTNRTTDEFHGQTRRDIRRPAQRRSTRCLGSCSLVIRPDPQPPARQATKTGGQDRSRRSAARTTLCLPCASGKTPRARPALHTVACGATRPSAHGSPSMRRGPAENTTAGAMSLPATA